MRKSRGFTVVELVVVMVIMAILLGLGFLMASRTQANARDSERDSDAQVIAQGIENRYKEGNPRATSSAYQVGAGSYPGTIEMLHITGVDETANSFSPGIITGGYAPDVLLGTSVQNFSPPGISSAAYAGFTVECTAGGCASEQMSTINSLVTKDVYLYEPVNAANQVCTGANAAPCVRFNLYWRDEVTSDTSTGSSNVLHVIRSRHQ